ncbi:MAG: hypothetical protein Q7S99_17635 [Parvibaculum sp.]|nr:hypothetical protein [Parvibaculum sp.]
MTTGYTFDGLIKMYRADSILPDTPDMRALTATHITPNVDAIMRDMLELRAETDAHFRGLLAGKAADGPHRDGGLGMGAVNYPISFCLEITRHMLALMSREPVPVHMTGLQALHNFVRAGGQVKRVWGALRGGYFQNAIQVGTYYLDVANDTVTVTKPKIEMLLLADASFNNITSFFEFARVGQIYWKARIIPNIYFPNVAPFLPAIAFDASGAMRLEARNSYMFPMNMASRFRSGRDFVMDDRETPEALAPYAAAVRRYADLDPRCHERNHPLWYDGSAREALEARFTEVTGLDEIKLMVEINRALGPDTQLTDSAKVSGDLPHMMTAEN